MSEEIKTISPGLVSVIMPTYNSESYIDDTIQSVLNQTYQDWELIVVDDHSIDQTPSILKTYSQKDPRIKLIVLEENSGAAIARNTAIKQARGEYLAFLDSDDLWAKDKLMKQLAFMQQNNYTFTSTSYAEIDEKNEPTGTIIEANEKLDYDGVLKYCPGNSTIIYNAGVLGKFYIPDIRRRNDFVMWLKVIKKARYVYGIKEPLTQYRVREGSLSKDKTKLIKYQWKVYRDIEKLSLPKSIYLLLHKIFTILKR